ncbi:hypothetical protein QQG55_38160 [Brugia pahangi]
MQGSGMIKGTIRMQMNLLSLVKGLPEDNDNVSVFIYSAMSENQHAYDSHIRPLSTTAITTIIKMTNGNNGRRKK